MTVVQGEPNVYLAADHAVLINLAVGDPHPQYLFLAGRLGGQVAVGGTAVADQLDLRGSSDVGLGRIHLVSPTEFEFSSNAAEQTVVRWEPTFTQSTPYVGGFIRSTPDITYTNATWIFGLLQDFGQYRAGVGPGFAAHTLFNAVGVISNSGNFDLVQSLVLNVGMTHERNTAGTSTTVQTVGVSFAPQTRASALGAVMTRSTGNTAVNCAPTFSTVAGSTANLGTQRGLHCRNVSVALFQPGAGVETMTAYFGLDFDNITFGGTVPVAAVRSNLVPGTGQLFLDNPGGAHSDFGGGHLFDIGIAQHLADGVLGSSSYGAAGGDITEYWDGTSWVINPLVGNNLEWTPFAAYWELDSDAAGQGLQINLETVTFGTTAASPANFFVQFAAPNLRSPQIAGEYADVLWTAGGTIDVNGLAITNGDAYKINAASWLLSGGSISDASTLHVAAMTSEGIATRTQALRVLGRARIDGLLNFGVAILATLTADVAALSLPPNNLGRRVLDMDADALGPWTIQGIVNTQTGDDIKIFNSGANAFDFGHEDAAAAAADRIITPTAATWTLGAREFAVLWYDVTVSRWRIFESNGA